MRLGAIVQRPEQFADEPDLIAFRVIAPSAAQNDELDFVGDVAHLVGQIAFGHA